MAWPWCVCVWLARLYAGLVDSSSSLSLCCVAHKAGRQILPPQSVRVMAELIAISLSAKVAAALSRTATVHHLASLVGIRSGIPAAARDLELLRAFLIQEQSRVGNGKELQDSSVYASYGSLLMDNSQGYFYQPVHPEGVFYGSSASKPQNLSVMNPFMASTSGSQYQCFEDMQEVDCTQVPRTNANYGVSYDVQYQIQNPESHMLQSVRLQGEPHTVISSSVLTEQPADINMEDYALNLSQQNGMTYSQMMQRMETMNCRTEPGKESFLDLLNGPMGNENKMFMITGRSEYVHNSDDDDALDNGATGYNFSDKATVHVQPDQDSDTNGDSAHKYNDTWVNASHEGQSTDNNSSEEEECSEHNVPDNQENSNIHSTVDLEGVETDGEEKSVQEDAVIHELSQEDIEIYIENESVKAAQTCSQEVRSHHVPQLNQVFDSDEAAFEFYSTYAEILGFSAKRAANYHCRGPGKNNQVTRYTFKCNRSGKPVTEEQLEERKRKRDLKKEETRRKKMQDKGETEPLQPQPAAEPSKTRKRNRIEKTGCLAEMIVTLKGDKWFVTSLNMDHNHELSPPEESRFLRRHKQMTDHEKMFIRTFNSVKLPTRKIMAILTYLRGGTAKAVPYTKKFVSNIRTAMRKESRLNDMMQSLEYFKKKQAEDPRFYFDFKVDKNNTVENIFWCDATSRRMYDLYGDCISFDTTFKTNRYNMPFAPFVGVTGHGDNCLFGCAILQNESAETFEWLFRTFLKCMDGKCPKTIITDQDKAMAKAIPAVFLQAIHRNCLFHVVKKVEEKHPRTFAKIPNLHNEFKDTIHFSLTVAEFESSWQDLLQKYKVGHLKYFKKIWEIKEKFVPVYFKNDFFPFIHSTARSEGTNAVFKDNVGSTYSVSSFLCEFDKIAENIEENEKQEDSITRTTTPTYWCGNDMEVQAGKRYNRKIFYRFQKQLKFTCKLHVEEVQRNLQYDVFKSGLAASRDYRTRKYLVLVDMQNEDFSCICSKMNKDGILCSHVLKVLIHLNITEIPEKYFIDRWKPREKKYLRDLRYNVPLQLTGECSQLRYNVLSKVCLNVASDGSKSNDKYLFVTEEVKKIAEKLDEMTLAEEKEKDATSQGKEKDAVPDVQSNYGNLNDPKVVKPKGRPTVGAKNKIDGRYKSFGELLFTKQASSCSHCGCEQHNIQTCTNLHLDSSLFPKKKRPRKKPSGNKKGQVQN